MKDLPILFRGAMVQAQIADAKTETRRLAWRQTGVLIEPDVKTWKPTAWQTLKPGDRLWVRERTMCTGIQAGGREISVRYVADGTTREWIRFPPRLKFQPEIGKCLSMGCYREASRITWVVTAVRMEPLQNITREDAIAEGMRQAGLSDYWTADPHNTDKYGEWSRPELAYEHLWRKLHGADSWNKNPEVVVITGEIHKVNIDALGR